jgi:hypothetical protein
MLDGDATQDALGQEVGIKISGNGSVAGFDVDRSYGNRVSLLNKT